MLSQMRFLGDNVGSILEKLELLCTIASDIEDVNEKLCINLSVARTSLMDSKQIIDHHLTKEIEVENSGACHLEVKEETKEEWNENAEDEFSFENNEVIDTLEFESEEIKIEPGSRADGKIKKEERKVKREERRIKMEEKLEKKEIQVPRKELTPLETAHEFIKHVKTTLRCDEHFPVTEVMAAIENNVYTCFVREKTVENRIKVQCKICSFSPSDDEVDNIFPAEDKISSSLVEAEVKSWQDKISPSLVEAEQVKSWRDKISQHIVDTHFKKINCPTCQVELFEFEVDKHISMDHVSASKLEKRVSCPTCGKLVADKKKLKYHMEVHTLDRNIPCDLCDKKYRTAMDLRHHKQKAHTGKMFPCTECDKSFTQKCYLQRHVKIVHENLVPMECTECGKVFPNEMKLNRHMALHTIPATIPCDICHKMYREQKDLNLHKKQIHTVAYETCKICGSTFKNKTHLNDHMKSHSGIKDKTCDLCGKGFSQNKVLKRHVEQFHAEKNQFSCHLCEKTFKYKNSLYQHLKGHEGLEACTCEECGKSFSMKSNLKKHMRRVHKIFEQKRIKLPMDIKEYLALDDKKQIENLIAHHNSTQQSSTLNTSSPPQSKATLNSSTS